MTDLKPCPFCGGEATQKPHMLFVFCEKCGICTGDYTGLYGNFQKEHKAAKTAWNTRANDLDTVTIKRGDLCHVIGLLQACKDWKENAASTKALSILETALGEKK